MDEGGDRGTPVAALAWPSLPLRESPMTQQITETNALAIGAQNWPTSTQSSSGSRHRAPVRVKLQRVNAIEATAHPPEEEREEWSERLEQALGTCSSSFVDSSLAQLIAACRLPRTGVSEIAVNAALAFIEGVKPRNEVEAALALQMAANHAGIMNVFSRFHGDYGGETSMVMCANAVGRLQRSFALQVETLRRLRTGGQQVVRVEHVHVEEGAQAVIGAVCAGNLIR
jgi:hypothetical protein